MTDTSKVSHYNRGNIEVIDFIDDQKLNFNLRNVIKYVTRAGYKQNNEKITDLKKALYYLMREIDNLEKQ